MACRKSPGSSHWTVMNISKFDSLPFIATADFGAVVQQCIQRIFSDGDAEETKTLLALLSLLSDSSLG